MKKKLEVVGSHGKKGLRKRGADGKLYYDERIGRWGKDLLAPRTETGGPLSSGTP